MKQLRLAVVCQGWAVALLLFVPREFGGWIGVVTLIVTGTVLAMTAPLGETHDSTIRSGGSGSENEDRYPEPPDHRTARHTETSDSLADNG